MRAASLGAVRTPVSDRYALPLRALCALALVPVACTRTRACAATTARTRPRSCPRMGNVDPRRATHMEQQFTASQWREGKLAAGERRRPSSRYVVIRSYEPEAALLPRHAAPVVGRRARRRHASSGSSPTTARCRSCARRSTRERPERPRAVIASLLVYEGEPGREGLARAAARRAAPALHGRRPMTFFAVRGDVPEPLVPAAEARARQLLLDSWRTYRAICGG